MVQWWSEETDELMDDLEIPEEEKEEFARYMSELGREAQDELNPRALNELRRIYEDAGWVEEAQYFQSQLES
ncbi:MAG: hypothetical protein QW175_07845, partial [Candidatus Bathyarchaeia archaeon]